MFEMRTLIITTQVT